MSHYVKDISFDYRQPSPPPPNPGDGGCQSSINCTAVIANTTTNGTNAPVDKCTSPIHYDKTCDQVVRHRSSMVIFLLCLAWILTVIYACAVKRDQRQQDLETGNDESSRDGQTRGAADPQKRAEEIQKVINIRMYTSNAHPTPEAGGEEGEEKDGSTVAIDVIEETGANSVCNICLESLRDGAEIASAKNGCCHHEYHAECLSLWLAKHDDCPNCRQSYFVPG